MTARIHPKPVDALAVVLTWWGRDRLLRPQRAVTTLIPPPAASPNSPCDSRFRAQKCNGRASPASQRRQSRCMPARPPK